MALPTDMMEVLTFTVAVVVLSAMVVALAWLSHRGKQHKREHDLERLKVKHRAKREKLYTLAEVAERVQEPMPFTPYDNKAEQHRQMEVDVQESSREKVARELVKSAGLGDVSTRQMKAKVEAEERADADGGEE